MRKGLMKTATPIARSILRRQVVCALRPGSSPVAGLLDRNLAVPLLLPIYKRRQTSWAGASRCGVSPHQDRAASWLA